MNRIDEPEGQGDERTWTPESGEDFERASENVLDGWPASPPAAMRRSEEQLRAKLIGLLTVHDGNVQAVSKAIAVRRTQVYRWIGRLGIDVDAFRRRRGKE